MGQKWGNTQAKAKRATRWCQRRKVLYLLIGAGAIASAVWLDHVSPPPTNPAGFWGVLFANRVIFSVVRVAIIFAASYVVYSVIHNVSRGVPLRELAGAKVADRVSDETTALRQAHENVVAERDSLVERLAASNETIGTLGALVKSTAERADELLAQLNPTLLESLPAVGHEEEDVGHDGSDSGSS